MIAAAAALVLLIGPLIVGAIGASNARRVPTGSAADVPWNWKLTAASALLYVLAYNLTFFIQELFLVLPKAFTPGLRPTLFHNNHTWEGEHPLAGLLQGTGASAILLSGLACLLLVTRGARRSWTLRLFAIWMAYNGFFQALPQVVIGSVNPKNDVGMAMDYLQFSPTAKTIAALAALAAMPLVAASLTRPLLKLADGPQQVSSAGARTRFIFHVATLPALIAIALIIPFRVPRDYIEVLVPPVVAAWIGIAWIQAMAWRASAVGVTNGSNEHAIAYPLGAVLLLLLVFQLVLRPGIAFF